jgi:Na+-transporting methylmalonyl-CoA/oxaloacetate decarboxylase gamma subunit
MNQWSSLRGTMITGSIRFLLSTLFVLMCIMAWMGKSALHASEENTHTTWVRFSNEAQAQHAKNVATSAALQDPRVKEAIAKAKETGDPEDIAKARALLERTVRAITQNIADMRVSGIGWGEIAHRHGIHPSVLGLGHSKKKTQYGLQRSKQARTRSKIRETTAKSSKGGRGHGHGGGRGGGKK